MDSHRAQKLKDEGNICFSKRDFAGAESCYSRALVIDPNLTTLYTNRAMCRFNLEHHDGVIADCDACLSLETKNIKANYYKSKSLLELDDTDAACDYALRAYEACRATDDKSLDMTMTHLLRCRSERWQRRERQRKREAQDLERKMLDLLERDWRREAAEAEGDVEKQIVQEEGEQEMGTMRQIFEKARQDSERKREVPEWLLDDISFNVMVDPVVTHTGRSYERASIQAAINNNSVDPVTREPLAKGELRPNIVLKQACEWFLEQNGWAYDW